MNSNPRALRAGLALAALMAAATVQAAPVTYNFSGTVNSTFLPGQFAIGSNFSGSFSFDSAAVDGDGSSSAGLYAAGFSINATVGGITFSNQVASGGIKVWDGLSGRDRFDAIVQGSLGAGLVNTSTPVAGFEAFVLRAVFDDTSSSAFSSDALPGSPLNLGAFDFRVFQLSFYQGFNQVNVIGDITSLSLVGAQPTSDPTVPEPQSLALVGLGLALACAGSARRRA
jgi:hypothetical protein